MNKLIMLKLRDKFESWKNQIRKFNSSISTDYSGVENNLRFNLVNISDPIWEGGEIIPTPIC